MKVLMLIDGMGIGGAETHVLTLARALVKAGIQVEVMCAGGAYTEELRRSGIFVHLAPFKGRDLCSVLGSMLALFKCRKAGYTVVHAHTRFTAALANLCLPRLPLVTTVHLDFSLSAPKRALSCWGRRALAVSPDLKEYLVREYGVCEKDIFLTKNAVDPTCFPFLPMRGKDILHVSRLDKDRSLCAHLLCAVAPKIHRRFPAVKIRIYGDGDDFPAVVTAAERANRAAGTEIVILCGSTCRISEALSQGAIAVGVSRAVLEAACRGLPVILSGNDGYGGIMTKEIYEKRKNDNFCCRKCAAAAAEPLFFDICFLLEHACLCERLRREISRLVRRDFAPERMAEDALAAYHSALRVGIIGYYGYGNFGDEMMLRALCEALRARGVKTVLPLTRRGGRGVPSRTRPLRALRMLRRCDTVLFGGGNLLQNETSPRSFFYYALFLLLCRRETLVGAGMGIGALHGERAERLCGRLLPRFAALYLRTQADTAYALRLAPSVKDRVHTVCDPCLLLSEHKGRAVRKKKILAIAKESKNPDFLAFLEEKKSEGYEILVLCLFPEKDRTVAEEIAARCGTEVQSPRSAEDFFAAAEDAALCISERLHGAVFSLLSHTPCLLFANNKKNTAFAREVAQAAERCGSPSPILCVRSKDELRKKEREAKGSAFGFSEIIAVLRNP